MPRRATSRPTIQDVASAAGVDKAVVSKVLSGNPSLRIRPETRSRVEQAVEDVGYVPNRIAQGLRTSTTGTLGLAIPDFANPVYAEIIRGAEAAARASGAYLLTTATNGRDDSSFALLREGRVDALLVGDQQDVPALQSALQNRWLALNNRGIGADRWIILDDGAAVSLAVGHLKSLGHRNIAFVGGRIGSDTSERRLGGYHAAMEEFGLKIHDGYIDFGAYKADGGAVAINKILDTATVPPTAVIVANLISAAGVLAAVKSRGIAVPGDLSIVAIHDLQLAGLFDPPLTTVSLPLASLGQRGVEELLKPSQAVVQEVLTEGIELMVRASTAPPPRA